jgi:hypothetical protein
MVWLGGLWQGMASTKAHDSNARREEQNMATATKGNGHATPGLTGLVNLSNDGAESILSPYSMVVDLEGTADLLFHRYGVEAVAEKAAASKGSKAKKTDDVESYLYRNDAGQICMPGRYLQRAIVEAARFHQDPRSPRKMAKDLVQAAIVVTPLLAPMLVNGKPTKDWDYLDRQRVVVQRSAVTRERPAFRQGWRVEFSIDILLAEYISPPFIQRLVLDAGRFVGLGDFRPSYGRFVATRMEVLRDAA